MPFDHVQIAVSDLAASDRFYRTVLSALGAEPVRAGEDLIEWSDWDVLQEDSDHPLSAGLHVGFRASDRAAVDAFWRAGIDAGYADGGAPGPRPIYRSDYYGGFLVDPDGNSVEAVHSGRAHHVPAGGIDHLWLRVGDLDASRSFYAAIAGPAGISRGEEGSDRAQFRDEDFSFTLVTDGREPTRNVHIAFSARENETVREFHAAALAAGFEDNGAPGERTAYHPGYYGAFVLDPDGNNIELVNHNRRPGSASA